MENLTAPPPDCIPSIRMTLSFALFRGAGTRPQPPHHAATHGYAIDRKTPFAMACRRTARNCAGLVFPSAGVEYWRCHIYHQIISIFILELPMILNDGR
jgi:hypothetical protein